MAEPDIVFTNARLADGEVATLEVTNGRWSAIRSDNASPGDGQHVVDLGGWLVLPGFVEGHIHLDTSFYGDDWKPHKPCTAGFDVAERVAFQAENLTEAAPLVERACNQLDLCLSQGTTHMRSHLMVDGHTGLAHLEGIEAVRDAYRDWIDLQLVAFPQHGILESPGAQEYLDEACRRDCDVIGGLDPAGFDRDIESHLNVVFGIADKHGVAVDIHLHDWGQLGGFEIERIAERTRALGMQGQVTISHAYCLGHLPLDDVSRLAEVLADSGVAILTNAPGSLPFPPIHRLRAAGVTVFGGNDNLRDSWWPYGDGDMLNRANTIGYCSGFLEDWELNVAGDIVTDAGAYALEVDDYGLTEGTPADLVALPATHLPQAVAAVPRRRLVYKSGRLVAEDGKLAPGIARARSAAGG